MESTVYSESPAEVLEALTGSENPNRDPRKEEGALFPGFYDSGVRVQELLRLLVASFRPRTIMETGVAHGRSTQAFLEVIASLQAVDDSFVCALHSIDVDPRTQIGPWSSNPLWTFHLLTPENQLRDIFEEVGEIDLFFHDSDHGYRNQMLEYELAWQRLAPGGILVSDDASWSNAFLHFARQHNLKPLILSEAPKVAGLLQKPWQ
jgi:predicted O-methyltransferase YrrM